MLKPALFQSRLLKWFDQHGRHDLPWQQNKTPYRVWISEIMLQQTQVATVIPYYEKFMQRFPTLASLANANEDDVLHLWAGLGYYSRARNLHRAAIMIENEFHGQFPDNLADLQSLPGIGQSTAGAILSIAFQSRATILDGNVKRVLARVYGVEDPINEKATESILWDIAEKNTPTARIADYTQAIMDLGATCCTRSKPTCHACPFTKSCIAYLQQLTEIIPAKTAAKKIPTRDSVFYILQYQQSILLEKRKSTGIWGGLWSLPEMEGKPDEKLIRAFLQKKLGKTVLKWQSLPSFRHTFSHYHLQIHPVLIKLNRAPTLADQTETWYNSSQTNSVGLPKPIKQLLETLHDTLNSLPKAQQRSRRPRETARTGRARPKNLRAHLKRSVAALD